MSPKFQETPFEVVASGLEYPEGPIACADGSVLLVELRGGRVTRVEPDGSKSTVATTGGSPNGAAFGPDGKLYICNSGGFSWLDLKLKCSDQTISVTSYQPPEYTSGFIQRVDVATGAAETLFTSFSTENPFNKANPSLNLEPRMLTLPLKGPDDLVFDAAGGLWFSDWGKSRWRERDVTGVYYLSPGSSAPVEVIFPLDAPNGIALSPDGSRLYVAETYARRIRYWKLDGPGQVAQVGPALDHSFLLSAEFHGQGSLDSMKVDHKGNVWVVTLLPHGAIPTSNGGITIISPNGEVLEFLEIKIPGHEHAPLPSNLCFGGRDQRTLFVTCGGSGLLVKCQVSVPGLPLAGRQP